MLEPKFVPRLKESTSIEGESNDIMLTSDAEETVNRAIESESNSAGYWMQIAAIALRVWPPQPGATENLERINDIYNDSDYLRKVVKMGAERARESASKTVREVREIIGYKPF